jgi:hypothetical protein
LGIASQAIAPDASKAFIRDTAMTDNTSNSFGSLRRINIKKYFDVMTKPKK